MKYISTRGQSPAVGFSEILLGGLAPDGGLYLPESYPHFTDADLSAMRDMNYRDWETDRKSTRLNSSHSRASRMPSSA